MYLSLGGCASVSRCGRPVGGVVDHAAPTERFVRPDLIVRCVARSLKFM